MTAIPWVTVALIVPVKYGCTLLITWCLWISEFQGMWTAFIASALCPSAQGLLVCLNWWPLFPWGTLHSNIFSRTLRQKHWGALPKILTCGTAEPPELLSLCWAEFQFFGLLSSGAEAELYTKRNHISVCLSKCRDNQNLPSGSHLALCSLSTGSEFRLFQDDALCHHCIC